MRKDDYLSSQAVKDFIGWMETHLDTPDSFAHGYVKKKGRKNFEFDNLFSAYKKYDWPYIIDEFSAKLIWSLVESDDRSCVDACCSILEWGGVLRGNKERLSRLTPNPCAYFLAVQARLTTDLPSSEYFIPDIHMTSGFSKIYSAYIDDFIIYDGRVGAALGLLVRMFCEQTILPSIPHELLFAWARGRGSIDRRNPSRNGYNFPEIIYYRPGAYFENNIRANWLISEIARTTKSEFAKIEKPLRLRALEQALFMIGYDVSGSQSL